MHEHEDEREHKDSGEDCCGADKDACGCRVDTGTGNGGKKEQIREEWLQGSTLDTLRQWLVILDLSPEPILISGSFTAWVIACGREVREGEDGALVIRGPGGGFHFMPANTAAKCESEYTGLREEWLNAQFGPGIGSE